jgi:hypothetical protein
MAADEAMRPRDPDRCPPRARAGRGAALSRHRSSAPGLRPRRVPTP